MSNDNVDPLEEMTNDFTYYRTSAYYDPAKVEADKQKYDYYESDNGRHGCIVIPFDKHVTFLMMFTYPRTDDKNYHATGWVNVHASSPIEKVVQRLFSIDQF